MTAPKNRLARTFYTYLWLRDDGTPYYVGKGVWGNHPERAFRRGRPSSEFIITQDHETEEAAFFAEKFLISYYGRKDVGTGCLRNLTDGGEGNSGLVVSQETRQLLSEQRKGKPNPAARGPRTDAFCQRLSDMKKGKYPTHIDPQTHSDKMTGSGNPMYGKKRIINEQWRNKLSEGKIGHTVTQETRATMSAIGKRRTHKQTHCYRGHEFTPENTWIGKSGSRFCLECRKLNHLAENERKREKRKQQ